MEKSLRWYEEQLVAAGGDAAGVAGEWEQEVEYDEVLDSPPPRAGPALPRKTTSDDGEEVVRCVRSTPLREAASLSSAKLGTLRAGQHCRVLEKASVAVQVAAPKSSRPKDVAPKDAVVLRARVEVLAEQPGPRTPGKLKIEQKPVRRGPLRFLPLHPPALSVCVSPAVPVRLCACVRARLSLPLPCNAETTLAPPLCCPGRRGTRDHMYHIS